MNKGPLVNKIELRGVCFIGFSELPLIHLIMQAKSLKKGYVCG